MMMHQAKASTLSLAAAAWLPLEPGPGPAEPHLFAAETSGRVHAAPAAIAHEAGGDGRRRHRCNACSHFSPPPLAAPSSSSSSRRSSLPFSSSPMSHLLLHSSKNNNSNSNNNKNSTLRGKTPRRVVKNKCIPKMACPFNYRLDSPASSHSSSPSPSSIIWENHPIVGKLRRKNIRITFVAAAAPDDAPTTSDEAANSSRGADADNDDFQKFIIIEGRDTVEDFAKLQLQEIAENIKTRRNKIFLLMEEVRRLRIQQRLRKAENKLNGHADPDEDEMPEYPSSIPLLPPLTTDDLKLYYLTFFSVIAVTIVFGGIFAPMVELKLGLGGSSYAEFIHSMHLPAQLSQVDPIVASFSGGAVGVISALMVVELNNVKVQEEKKCKYCSGTGYLACGRCSGSGQVVEVEAANAGGGGAIQATALVNRRVQTRCSYCSGVGKVMCTSCLCTGREMATEHDLRIDPFV